MSDCPKCMYPIAQCNCGVSDQLPTSDTQCREERLLRQISGSGIVGANAKWAIDEIERLRAELADAKAAAKHWEDTCEAQQETLEEKRIGWQKCYAELAEKAAALARCITKLYTTQHTFRVEGYDSIAKDIDVLLDSLPAKAKQNAEILRAARKVEYEISLAPRTLVKPEPVYHAVNELCQAVRAAAKEEV